MGPSTAEAFDIVSPQSSDITLISVVRLDYRFTIEAFNAGKSSYSDHRWVR